ncbi:MAG: sulfatase [PVC group bacterium]
MRVFVAIIICFFLLIPSLTKGSNDSSKLPNIVIIILDAARADHFSSYGYGKKTTPLMDAIGRKGAVFLNNFVQATETYTSLPLILSSRYFSNPIFQMDTWSWGMRRENQQTVFKRFDDQQILLPAFLSASGYWTAMFHNHPWFVDETDLVKAFDESFIFPTDSRDPVDGRMVDAILSWIAKHREDRFFIYCHIMSPHQPYPPKDADLDFIPREKLSDLNRVREKFNRCMSDNSLDWTPEELSLYGVMYDSNLKHTDVQVGRLYKEIEKLCLAEKTIFIITSDHGELLGQHGRLAHGDFLPWDPLIHVPLIMIWPGKIPPTVRLKGLTESVDIFPTIVDICGLELPPGKALDGVSLKRLFRAPTAGREAVYAKGVVRTPKYKFYVNRDLFFEIQKDPGEEMNISNSRPAQLKK